MTSLSDLILSRTPIISVPSKMAFYTPTGKLKEVSTLTKGGAISTRNKEKIIQFIGNNDNIFRIDAQGHSEKNKPEKKEQEAMGREDINIKGSTMKEKKEQEMMGAEDVDIKGSTMKEKKEEQGMGAEDVDIKNEFEKILQFLELKNITIPPIRSKRELELEKMHHHYLRDMLADIKDVDKINKNILVEMILKREGIKKGIKPQRSNPLYQKLVKLYKEIDEKPITRYNEYKKIIKEGEDFIKKNKHLQNQWNKNITEKEKLELRRAFDKANVSKTDNLRFHIHQLQSLITTDYSPLLE